MHSSLNRMWVLASILVLLFVVPHSLSAQSLGLSITPPLTQISMDPGGEWNGQIKVVNPNQNELTIFVRPVLFAPSGEEGQGRFLPQLDNVERATGTILAWLSTPEEAIVIAPEKTAEIPISLTLPDDAPPGGHYAALLVTTENPNAEPVGNTVTVNSAIASLLFLRVSGTVVESGKVRDFFADRTFFEHPEAGFTLRFENTGTVHILPQGSITIYNMFGKKRGYVPINQSTSFGNVLPGTIRKFRFTWKSDEGAYDIGRYRAVATLTYGSEGGRQNVSSTAYFYVVPFTKVAQVLGFLAFFITFFVWAVRAYVRRALRLAEALRPSEPPLAPDAVLEEHAPSALTLTTLLRPIQQEIVDLRAPKTSRVPVVQEHSDVPRLGSVGVPSVRRYAFALAFVTMCGIAWVVASAFFEDVLVYEREFEVKVEGE